MSSWQSKVVKMSFRLQRLRGQGSLGVDVAAERERYEGQLARLRLAKGVTFTNVSAGSRPALWVDPPKLRREEAILYLHGGAYLMGSPRGYRSLASAIAVSAGMRVLL